MRESIGVIGLGLVGSAIAARIMDAGYAVHGFDVRDAARDALASAGGTPCSSARAVGAVCPVVVLAVFDSDDVIEVTEGEEGLLGGGAGCLGEAQGAARGEAQGAAQGAAQASHCVRSILDCSTGDPGKLTALAARLLARGIDFIEAPLSGSSQQIEAGEATQLLGGEADAIARCAAVLDAISPRRIHTGAAGSAARAKLATNLVLGLNRAALAEGMAYAETQGITPETFLSLVLATPARSAAAELKGPLMVGERWEPQSRIRQHHKDVQLMLQAAHAAGQPLPLSQAHADIMQRAIAAGDGDLDNAAILRQWRRERGA